VDLIPRSEHVPIEFSEGLIEKAERVARTGASIPRIAESCLVDAKNFRRWLTLGRDEPERYALFHELYERVTKARNSAHDQLLGKVMESSQEDWKAASWVLERSFGYHKNQEVQIQAPDQPLTLELIARIPAEKVQQIEAESVEVNGTENKTTDT